MKGLIESIAIAMLEAFYGSILYSLLSVVGVSNLTLIGWILVLVILPTYVGAFWFLFREPEGIMQVVVIVLIVLPFIYLFILIVGMFLTPWLSRFLKIA